jgi:hypothetical protein
VAAVPELDDLHELLAELSGTPPATALAEAAGPPAEEEAAIGTSVVKLLLFALLVVALFILIVTALAVVLNRKPSKRPNRYPQMSARGTRPAGAAPPPPDLPVASPAAEPHTPDSVNEPVAPATAASGPSHAYLQGTTRTQSGFFGTLGSFSVSLIIQFLHSIGETGVLTVGRDGEADESHVYFAEGEVIDVECRGHKGIQALRELLGISTGNFSFSHETRQNRPRELQEGTMSLLMHAAQSLDEKADFDSSETAQGVTAQV